MRKIVAARMVGATSTIPHYRLVMDAEISALLQLRKDMQANSRTSKLSLNDLLIKACALALVDCPAVNIQWGDQEIRRYRSADISVVTALAGGGLTTPIIRSADTKSVWEISAEVKELVARAASNTLKMDEILGGTFSMSNLGMYGIDQFDAIINPPQCAILAIGAAKQQMLVSDDGSSRVGTVMRLTLSLDHRAIDGATGAAFLLALKQHLGQPAYLRVGAAP